MHRAGLAATLCCALIVFPAPGHAHPHVWVTAEATVVFDKGAVAGLRQKWTFDEFYTAMAIEGLDANNDGVFDRNELAELATVNMEGLKDFNYFTTASVGASRPDFDTPKEYWLEYGVAESAPGPAADAAPADTKGAESQAGEPKAGLLQQLGRALFGGPQAEPVETKPKVLSLNFLLPLKEPAPVAAMPFSFSVADPSFFIWFDLAKNNPVRLAEGAPQGCSIKVGVPAEDAAEVKRLNEAFTTQLGPSTSNNGSKTVAVECPK